MAAYFVRIALIDLGVCVDSSTHVYRDDSSVGGKLQSHDGICLAFGCNVLLY